MTRIAATLVTVILALAGPALPSRGQDAGTPSEPESAPPDAEGAAPADEEGEQDEIKGTYLAAGFVYGVEQFHDIGGRDVDDSPGFSAWLGQMFWPQAGVEIQWEWIDEFKIDDFFGPRGDGKVEINTLTVNGRILPLGGMEGAIPRVVQPFVKFGAGFAAVEIEDQFHNDTDDASFLLRGGGGIWWRVTPRFGVVTSAEYVYPTDDVEGVNYDYISTSVAFQVLF
jgi:hypothetical protein